MAAAAVLAVAVLAGGAQARAGARYAASAMVKDPAGIAVDAAGNALFADRGNNRIRVVAAGTGTFYGQAMTAGDIYTIAGTGRAGSSGDGGPATGAKLKFVSGVALDGADNVLIADTNNNRIQVVAESTGTFYGQAMTAGHIYSLLSGLLAPSDVVADAAGNLVVADTEQYQILVLAAKTGSFYGQNMTVGDVYTIAGTGTRGFSGDGGPGGSAEINSPYAVAPDPAGNLLFADYSNNRIRQITG